MKRARRMGLHPRHDLSNPTRRCVEATIRQRSGMAYRESRPPATGTAIMPSCYEPSLGRKATVGRPDVGMTKGTAWKLPRSRICR